MKKAKARRGITVVEAAFISSVTVILGLVLVFLASGWAQVFMHDLGQKTDEHVQSFRSLLVAEAIKYAESGVEIRLRNVSKWNISLTIMEMEVLKDNKLIGRFPEDIVMWKDEAASLPVPVDCERGRNMTARIKYAPTALSGKGLQPLVIEVNFTCPISNVPHTCNLPEEWALIDVVDLITTPSGEISQRYPFIWIRAPLSSAAGDKSISVQIHGQEGGFLGSFPMRLPSANQIPLKISGEGIRPPYSIVLDGPSYTPIPRNFVFGAFIEKDEIEAHVSGMILLWRPEDKIAEGLIIELGALAPGDYTLRVKVEDCNGVDLLTLEKIYNPTSDGRVWDLIYVKFSKELKVTDIYSIKMSIIREGS